MAKIKLPNFEDEKRYRVRFGAPAEYRDTRFLPRHEYTIKGKVAQVVKEAIVSAEPV